jgi:beta-lactamase class A
MYKSRGFIFSLLILVVGAGLGYFFGARNVLESPYVQMRLGREEGGFINPLLACDIAGDAFLPVHLKSLRQEIDDLVAGAQKAGEVSRMSVYYRDLDSGKWIGVNEDEKFIPASLTKVPLMMAYYMEAETNPEILDKQILFPADSADEDRYQEVGKPPDLLEPGKTYPVSALLRRMIVYSGNNSHFLLSDDLNPEVQVKVYTDLGAYYQEILGSGIKDSLSVQTFATFFRALYNATYLSREYSEKALRLLSEAVFADGIRAGVPAEVPVAHKFGERTIHIIATGAVVTRELHDCGIVYDRHPYLLCVMTEGKDFSNIEKSIQRVSALIYREHRK